MFFVSKPHKIQESFLDYVGFNFLVGRGKYLQKKNWILVILFIEQRCQLRRTITLQAIFCDAALCVFSPPPQYTGRPSFLASFIKLKEMSLFSHPFRFVLEKQAQFSMAANKDGGAFCDQNIILTEKKILHKKILFLSSRIQSRGSCKNPCVPYTREVFRKVSSKQDRKRMAWRANKRLCHVFAETLKGCCQICR